MSTFRRSPVKITHRYQYNFFNNIIHLIQKLTTRSAWFDLSKLSPLHIYKLYLDSARSGVAIGRIYLYDNIRPDREIAIKIVKSSSAIALQQDKESPCRPN